MTWFDSEVNTQEPEKSPANTMHHMGGGGGGRGGNVAPRTQGYKYMCNGNRSIILNEITDQTY